MMITPALPMVRPRSASRLQPENPTDTFTPTVPLAEAARQLLRPAPTQTERPTARFRWEGISSPPAVGPNGTLYLGVTGGKTPFEGVLQARTPDGTVLWSVETKGKCQHTPLLHDGKLVVPLSDPFSVSTYDLASGQLLATRKDAGGPLVAGKSGVFARTWRQEIVRVDGGWTFPLKTTESLAELKVAPDGQLYASTRQGTLYALDPQSGRQLWSCPAPDGHFTVDQDRVFVPSPDRHAVIELGHDGQQRRSLGGFQRANPCGVAPNGTLLVADLSDALHNNLKALDRDGRQLWSSPVKEPAVETLRYDREGHILVPSGNYAAHSGSLECFTGSGQLLWRAGMGGPPRLALGDDNALYALDSFYQLHALNDPTPRQAPAPETPPRVFNLGDAVVVGGVRVKKRP